MANDNDDIQKAYRRIAGGYQDPNAPLKSLNLNLFIDQTINISEFGDKVNLTIEVPGATLYGLTIEYHDSKTFTVRWIKPFMDPDITPENKEKVVKLINSYKLDQAFAYLKDGQLFMSAYRGDISRNVIPLSPPPTVSK